MELLAIFILRGGKDRIESDFDIRYNENILDIMGRYALHHKEMTFSRLERNGPHDRPPIIALLF